MATPNAVYTYLNTLYPTAHCPFVVHGSIWKVMQCNVILITSIKTLIAFWVSKPSFPSSGSSHRSTHTALQKCNLMKNLFPLLCQLPTSLAPMQGNRQALQRGQKLIGNEWARSSASFFATPSSQPICRTRSYADVLRRICWTGSSLILSKRGNKERLWLRATVFQPGSSGAAKCTFPY